MSQDRFDALLDRDWSAAWETLPEAPDLVPRMTTTRRRVRPKGVRRKDWAFPKAFHVKRVHICRVEDESIGDDFVLSGPLPEWSFEMKGPINPEVYKLLTGQPLPPPKEAWLIRLGQRLCGVR